MAQRLFLGKPAEITFTGDFHEIAAGDPRPGQPLLLRYDPHRIVPPEETYRFGDPDRPVTAHVLFRADAPPLDVSLRSPAGLIACPDADPTGQGSMLSAELTLPADADLLVLWFSYANSAGAEVYDSDNGANYRFGFPGAEIESVAAIVERLPEAPCDRFQVNTDTVAAVDAVAVQHVLVADRTCARHEFRLRRTEHTGAARWSGSADVPHGAIVRFRVCYWIAERRLIDDNGGSWYLAPQPEPDRPPPPPPHLLHAAANWR